MKPSERIRVEAVEHAKRLVGDESDTTDPKATASLIALMLIALDEQDEQIRQLEARVEALELGPAPESGRY